MRQRVINFISFFHLPLFQFIPTETFRYLFCGISTLVVDWVMYAGTYNLILQKHNIHLLDYTISASNFGKAIAILCAFIWGFALNKYVVFTDSPVKGRHQLFRYALIVSTCIGLNFLIINFLIRQFPLFDTFKTLANILTSFVVAIYSYIVQRSFTFKVHKK